MHLFNLFLTLLPTAVGALTIAEINGDRFLSAYAGQSVANVTGLVIAKGPSGIWIRSTIPDDSDLTSEAIYVFSSSVGNSLAVGDIITLDGRVSEFRSSRDYLPITEIVSPGNVAVVSSGNPVAPIVIGKDTPSPPNVQYTSLDEGDVFALPNNQSLISVENPILEPTLYGLDFWESLSGELVSIRNPRAISRPNNFGDTWVIGSSWTTTSKNGQGGLTMGPTDANPEAIIIGSPLDNSDNPEETKMGDELEDITGVMTNAFGFYRILPLTKISIKKAAVASQGPTTLVSCGACKGITVADYNVENLMPDSPHIPLIANHIVNFLKTPDLICIQEVQDNSGATDDGATAANVTLTALVQAIGSLTDVVYEFASVDTENNTDGGQPGGNIRVAYLYRPDILRLAGGLRQGGPTDANEVLPGPTLKYNPGRIDPLNPAWENSRKPVAAAWELIKGKKSFFTINVHWASKGGSSSLHGDARPPVNGAVEQRLLMAEVTGSFINAILAIDKNARIVATGDFNEFSFVAPIKMLEQMTGMKDVDEVIGTPLVERYTYLFDMNAQSLDHMLVSPSLQVKGKNKGVVGYEHLHLNSWATRSNEVSDHDPSVVKLNICGK